jgi:lipopolysaccharide/colanic/teichoic acid biosynthesis glycosyltransferase
MLPNESDRSVPPGTLPSIARLRQGRAELFSYGTLKRAIDIVGAASVLLLLGPLILSIMALIRLDSPGPAIFKQQRVGRRVRYLDGSRVGELQTFTLYKLRTMHQNSKSDVHRQFTQAFIRNDTAAMKAIQKDATNGLYKIVDDPRVTRVGKYLRKTSLDELPQLWNVLVGEMSLVGPRPPLPYEVELYALRDLERLCARPGITGLWQVSARSACDFDTMVDLDVWYIENQSLWVDLKILVMTLLTVFRGHGAE